MELYLIRHGLAGQGRDRDDDDRRPLTPAGQLKTRQVADRLYQLGLRCDRILTSPLRRAEQTAQILREAGLGDRVQIHPALAPGGAIGDLLPVLDQNGAGAELGNRIALVGHRPDLGHWAEQLLWGQAKPSNAALAADLDEDPRERFVIKKAGVVGLHLPDRGNPLGRSQLFWLVPPRLLVC